jgi:hypothetical protein
VSYVSHHFSPMTDEERFNRIVQAMLANIEGWKEQAQEIAEHAVPVTGNLGRGLHLLKSLEQASISLRKLADLPPE